MPAVPGSGPKCAGSGTGEDGSVYLKIDDWQWRIAVHQDDINRGIKYLGFEVEDGIALDATVQRLKALGIDVAMGSPAQAQARGVCGIAITRDPSGNTVELIHGPVLDRKFESPLGMQFKTGQFGLGHVNLLAAALEETQAFYRDVLGFKLTDFIRFGEADSANFYRCNARHHSLGITRVGDINGIHHLMLEVDTVDMVLQCLERVQDAGITITSTMGRHINDNMLSFYMSSPFGFDVEIGCDGLLIEGDWTAHEFVEGDLWGHRGLDPETIAENLAKLAQKED
jgi:3,4-dihydroxy-9,10-secoandrosta-1,3,5(10)-triene-9,17-dione 4,5-dioxygenase